MPPAPKPVTREDFDRLRQMQVEVEVGPLHKVPRQSPEPPRPQPQVISPPQPLLEESPLSWKKTAINYFNEISDALFALITLFSVGFWGFLAAVNPSIFKKIVDAVNSLTALYYKDLFWNYIGCFTWINNFYSLTNLPNLNIILYCLIVILNSLFWLIAPLAGILNWGFWVSSKRYEWSDQTISWALSLPYIILFGPAAVWVIFSIFAGYVDFIGWLISPK